jgi:hypothetical protein
LFFCFFVFFFCFLTPSFFFGPSFLFIEWTRIQSDLFRLKQKTKDKRQKTEQNLRTAQKHASILAIASCSKTAHQIALSNSTNRFVSIIYCWGLSGLTLE